METRFPKTTTTATRTTKAIQRTIATAAGVSALLIAGPAQAALEDRDLDGDTVVDAFYDTDLDITWLRNADVIGLKTWDYAVAWADVFSIGGYDDWRLPTADPACGVDFNCIGSEMGHLWYVELGNTAPGPMTNTGNFQNLQSFSYWSGTEFAPNPIAAWTFQTEVGLQNAMFKSGVALAMAVHPGDVGVVPEPQTVVLLLAGLTALALARRQRQR